MLGFSPMEAPAHRASGAQDCEDSRDAESSEEAAAAAPGRCDSASPGFWAYNIPICGGFCAPTVSPEGSWLRHFSNEFTLPASARFFDLMPVIEHSCCCTAIARCGCSWAERRRKEVLLFGAVMNLVCLALSVVAAVGGLSTTDSGAFLRLFSWVEGSGVVPCTTDAYTIANVTEHIPVMALLNVKMYHWSVDCSEAADPAGCESAYSELGFRRSSGGEMEQSTKWDTPDACTLSRTQDMEERCESCATHLISESTLIMAIVTQLPTIATDLQRATRFGDVNCQATMGVVSNLMSFWSSVVSLAFFRWNCYRLIEIPFAGFFCEMPVHIEWQLGWGSRCLAAAISIKIVDLACHWIVPTPEARWKAPGAEVQSLEEYLALPYASGASEFRSLGEDDEWGEQECSSDTN